MINRPGNDLAEWYPLVVGIVPTPVTYVIRKPGLSSEAEDTLILDLVDEIIAAGDQVGWPIFLRTGLTSAKHDWFDTCYVPDRTVVEQHVLNLIGASETLDPFGLPYDTWVVREFLATSPAFHAFGGTPINKERRYFVAEGEVVGWQPYWPPGAIFDSDTKLWRERLDNINRTMGPDEDARLRELTLRVASRVPGNWSVDWLLTDRGWFLTDMAHLEESYVWHDHPNAPDPKWFVVGSRTRVVHEPAAGDAAEAGGEDAGAAAGDADARGAAEPLGDAPVDDGGVDRKEESNGDPDGEGSEGGAPAGEAGPGGPRPEAVPAKGRSRHRAGGDRD